MNFCRRREVYTRTCLNSSSLSPEWRGKAHDQCRKEIGTKPSTQGCTWHHDVIPPHNMVQVPIVIHLANKRAFLPETRMRTRTQRFATFLVSFAPRSRFTMFWLRCSQEEPLTSCAMLPPCQRKAYHGLADGRCIQSSLSILLCEI